MMTTMFLKPTKLFCFVLFFPKLFLVVGWYAFFAGASIMCVAVYHAWWDSQSKKKKKKSWNLILLEIHLLTEVVL